MQTIVGSQSPQKKTESAVLGNALLNIFEYSIEVWQFFLLQFMHTYIFIYSDLFRNTMFTYYTNIKIKNIIEKYTQYNKLEST